MSNDLIPHNLKKKVRLSRYTTFKIGGPADYFFVAKNEEALISVLKWAKKSHIPYYIIGEGSNILVSDEGFRGLVIQIKNNEFTISGREIMCGAGLPLRELVQRSLTKNLAGLENLTGIPGTIGGAIYGNAGAFGHSISEFVKRVEFLDPVSLKIKSCSRKDCQLGYRNSIFKDRPVIILSAVFQLSILKNRKEVLDTVKKIRLVRLHHPSRNCAGSIFKNIPVRQGDKILSKVPPLCMQYGEIKTACLIQELGLKGKRIGGAAISEKHTNFIINRNKATAKNVLDLMDLIRREVYEKYKLVLETEIQFVGFK